MYVSVDKEKNVLRSYIFIELWLKQIRKPFCIEVDVIYLVSANST